MSLFHHIYIENNTNNDDKNNKKINKYTSFETYDLQSLHYLKYANNYIESIIDNFNPYKWKSKYTNALKLDLYTRNFNKFTNDILKNNLCFDSLYINNSKENNSSDEINHLIYVTPHIIFYNYIGGYSTVDIIYEMKLIRNIENICLLPKFVFRSHDDKSIEIFNDIHSKNNRYVTLKLFYDNDSNSNNKFDLENIIIFLNNIYEIFWDSNFIPYFIHPNRLILCKDESLKIISAQLLQFIFSPYISFKKIQHNIFSHPTVLINNKNNNNSSSNNNIKEKNILDNLMRNTVDLFLDFFHSLFVTVLWIYNNNNNISPESLTRNMYGYYNDVTSIFMRKNLNNKNKNNCIMDINENISKKNNINENNFEQSIFFNAYNNNNNNNETKENTSKNINPCTNIYGFCLSYYNNKQELTNIIHNYGCQHLLQIMPIILNDAIVTANENNDPKIFLSRIKIEFELFMTFLNNLKNIEKYDFS